MADNNTDNNTDKDNRFFLKECFTNIFIGDKKSVEKKSQIPILTNLAISKIINVAADHVFIDKTSFESNGILVTDIRVEDTDDFPISEYFDQTNQIINETLRDGKKVLVVCAGGISRSCTIVLAYLIAFENYYNVIEALNELRESRPFFNPNDGFKKQLEVYAKQQRTKKLFCNHISN